MTKSIHAVLADLEPDHIWIIYPGNHQYQLHEKVSVVPAKEIPSINKTFGDVVSGDAV